MIVNVVITSGYATMRICANDRAAQLTTHTNPIAFSLPPVMNTKSLAWKQHGALYVAIAHGSRLSRPHWQTFTNALAGAPRPTLLWLPGTSGIDALARRRLAEGLGGQSLALLVHAQCPDRGVATALRWLGVRVGTFEPHELESASRFLAVDAGLCWRALAGLGRLPQRASQSELAQVGGRP